METKPHRRIWLQYDPAGDTTWCQDKINHDDVEYVKAKEIDADLLQTALALARAERLLHGIADKLDAITKATAGIWTYLMVHGMEYDGPDYGVELESIKRFLKGREEAYERSVRFAGNGPVHGEDRATQDGVTPQQTDGDDASGAQE